MYKGALLAVPLQKEFLFISVSPYTVILTMFDGQEKRNEEEESKLVNSSESAKMSNYFVKKTIIKCATD